MQVDASVLTVAENSPVALKAVWLWLQVDVSSCGRLLSWCFIGSVAVASFLANPTPWLWLHMQVAASVLTVAENSPVALKAVWLWLQVAVSSCGRELSCGFIGSVVVAACLPNPTLWLWLHMQVAASV